MNRNVPLPWIPSSLALLASVAPAVQGPIPSAAPGIGPFFEPNRGQGPTEALFLGRTPQASVLVQTDGWILQLPDRDGCPGERIALQFEGASAAVSLAPEEPLAGALHYLRGADPSAWIAEVPRYGRVRACGLYPGLDLVLRYEGSRLEYDLLLEPGFDPRRIAVRCTGILGLSLDPDGSLVADTPAGVLRQRPPLTWQVDARGRREPLECRYRILGANRYGFLVPARDRRRALVIDPGLEWSTFLGGSAWESAYAAHVDAAGAVTVVGQTGSKNFPTTPGSLDTSFNGVAGSDVFVTRLDALGNLLYSTYIGGSGGEEARAVAAHASGAVTVAGQTSSSNFPTTAGAFDTTLGGTSDGFVLNLSPAGDSLSYSTLLGGGAGDLVSGVAVDAAGAATVFGTTSSSDFPTTAGAHDATLGGSSDAFAAKLHPSGSSLSYSTLIGGSDGETGMAVELDSSGLAVVAGVTSSPDFPVTPGAFDGTLGGSSDAFVARLDATGSALQFATFLGGSDGDTGEGVAVDAWDRITLAGVASSADFPVTAGAFDTAQDGTSDAFVARFDAAGTSLQYATFLGGSSGDVAEVVRVDSSGAATVAGVTSSGDFPVTAGAADTTSGGPSDAFVARLDAAGSSLVYSAFTGGSAGDVCEGMDVGPLGSATLVGTTSSSNFPVTAGAADASYSPPSEAFATRVDMLPAGVTRYGAPTPACLGPVAIGVSAVPAAGTGLAVTCVGAPPGATGFLVISFAPDFAGTPLLGAVVHVSLAAGPLFFPALGGSAGEASVPILLPAGSAGVAAYAQFAWFNTATCGGAGTVSSSNALEVVVQ